MLLKNPSFSVLSTVSCTNPGDKGWAPLWIALLFPLYFPFLWAFLAVFWHYPCGIDSLRWEDFFAASVRRRIKFLRLTTIAVNKAWIVTLSNPLYRALSSPWMCFISEYLGSMRALFFMCSLYLSVLLNSAASSKRDW